MNIEADQSQVSYERVHRWIYAARGRAGDNACVDCGQPAVGWSYRYGSAVQLTGDHDRPTAVYSYNPSDYDPRCTGCHNRYDDANGRNCHPASPPSPAATAAVAEFEARNGHPPSDRHRRRLTSGL